MKITISLITFILLSAQLTKAAIDPSDYKILADSKCINCEANACGQKGTEDPTCLRCKSSHGLKFGTTNECEQCKGTERKRSVEKVGETKCEECPTREILVSGRCQKCKDREERKDNTCVECEGNKIQENNKCIDKCKPYQIATVLNTCEDCPDSHIQKKNECEKCPDGNISEHGNTKNTCTPCKDDEIVEANVCKKCTGNKVRQGNECKACGSRKIKNTAGKCVDCKEREIVDSAKNQCIECKPHKIRVGNECKECKDDEYSKKNECVKLGGNQVRGGSDKNTPVDCKDNQYVKDNACNDCDSSCEKCVSPDGHCVLCKLGTYGVDTSNKRTCRQCIDSKCDNCAQDYTICEDCGPGDYLSGSSCKSCIPDCHLCTNEKNCFKCENGKYVKGGKCVDASQFKAGSIKCANDCKRCSTYLQCDQCNPGFYVNDDKLCGQCPGHCAECVTPEYCSVCASGYGKDDDGECVPESELNGSWSWWQIMLLFATIFGLIGGIGYCLFSMGREKFRSSNMLAQRTSYPTRKVENNYGGGSSMRESELYRSRSGGGSLQLSQNIGF